MTENGPISLQWHHMAYRQPGGRPKLNYGQKMAEKTNKRLVNRKQVWMKGASLPLGVITLAEVSLMMMFVCELVMQTLSVLSLLCEVNKWVLI